MEDFSDDRLIGMAKGGDVDAFAELTRRYQERVYRMILNLTRSDLDADDLTQETFLQAYRSLPGFRQQAGFYTWLYRIAVNLTLNFLKKAAPFKKNQRQDVYPDRREVGTSAENLTPPLSPEAHTLKRELRARLQDALASLPWGYRLAFILVELQGLSHRQASCILKCSEKTVSWRMFRARHMLQARLEPYLKEGVT